MKKYSYFFLIISLFYVGDLFGQHQQNSNQYLLDYKPPSPVAFEFTKHVDVPVNESAGQIAPSIPLMDFKSGAITVPIYMSYNGNGIKVDQVPGFAGYNWIVNAGGVVTREVRDLQDEQYSRVHPSFSTVMDLANSTNNNLEEGAYHDLIEGLTFSNIDTEVDIFRFNYLGNSGSFYLDEDNNAHILKAEKEYMIKFNYQPNNKSTIEIITPSGLKAFFGGEFCSDVTSSLHYSPENQTAFYLYKLENTNGDVIHFEYFGIIPEFRQNHSETMVLSQNDSGDVSTDYINSYMMISYLLDGAKTIKKIYNNNKDTIEFNSNKPFLNYDPNANSKLQNIVLTHNDDVINYAVYNYWENNHHRFLEEININNHKNYTFEYKDKELLPDFTPINFRAIDEWGYYNGKTSNTTLMPIHPLAQNNYICDRSPDFAYSSLGVLKKITYPTGGFDTFEYESGILHYNDVTNMVNTSLIAGVNQTPNIDVNDSATIEATNDGQATVLLQIIYSDVPVDEIIDGVLTIEDITTGDAPSTVHVLINTAHGGATQTETESTNSTFNIIEGHEYSLMLNMFDYDTGTVIDANNTLEGHYKVTANIAVPVITREPIEALGLRIKRIKTYKNEDDSGIIKRFYYNKRDLINTDEVLHNLQGRYTYPGTTNYFCENTEASHITRITESTMYTSDSADNIFIDVSQRRLYPYVTVSYGGDNFELGGKEMHFTAHQYGACGVVIGDIIYTRTGTNYDWDNGILKKEIIFDNNMNVKKEVTYQYITHPDRSSSIANYKVKKHSTGLPCIIPTNLDFYYDISAYTIYSNWHSIKTVTTKEYLNNNEITTIVDYFYAPSYLAGLPNIVNTTNSNLDHITKKIYYPTDAVSQLNINIPEIPELIAQNRISTPIQEETYKNSILNTTKRTNYHNFGMNSLGTNSIIMPETIETFKGIYNEITNPWVEHVKYYKIDAHGLPIEVSKTDGPHIYYVWGYHHTKLIAMIMNLRDASQFNSSIQNAINASDIDDYENSTTSEINLINALKSLQNQLDNDKQMTFFTYSPLIGVTSVTDPKGDTQYYHYDNFNRLQYVKDKDGHILKENEYHYRSN